MVRPGWQNPNISRAQFNKDAQWKREGLISPGGITRERYEQLSEEAHRPSQPSFSKINAPIRKEFGRVGVRPRGLTDRLTEQEEHYPKPVTPEPIRKEETPGQMSLFTPEPIRKEELGIGFGRSRNNEFGQGSLF